MTLTLTEREAQSGVGPPRAYAENQGHYQGPCSGILRVSIFMGKGSLPSSEHHAHMGPREVEIENLLFLTCLLCQGEKHFQNS
jgi:hypothetical protein